VVGGVKENGLVLDSIRLEFVRIRGPGELLGGENP